MRHPESNNGVSVGLGGTLLAKIPGRSMWLAAPAAVVCVVVILVLTVLAAPMVPVAASWVSATVQNALTPKTTVTETVSDELHDCRDLYPRDLWAEIMWSERPLLDQKRTAMYPDAASEALAQSLDLGDVLACSWTNAGNGRVTTALQALSEDPSSLAQTALTAAGYRCESTGAALSCRLETGSFTVLHSFGGNWWLSTAVSDWDLPRYGERLTAYLWGS